VSDVQETRRIHETAAIIAVCNDSALRALPVWSSLIMKIDEDGEILREDLIREMIVATGNRLSLKIWFLLKQYSKVPFEYMTVANENDIVKKLLYKLCEGNVIATLEMYSEWIELVESERGDRKK
jgi:GntR family transcriptional repressor for pyruvate dehydrogenase complex